MAIKMPRRPRTKTDPAMANLFKKGYSASTAEILTGVPLFDTITLATGTTTGVVRMFQNTVGQSGKTAADTNMVSAGNIPGGNAHIIRSIRVVYTGAAQLATAADVHTLYAMLNGTLCELAINGKSPAVQMVLSELMGITFGHSAAVAAGNQFNQDTVAGVYHLKRPIVLEENMSFEVRLNFTSAVVAAQNADKIKICLEGEKLQRI
jgi:hypothetical protein